MPLCEVNFFHFKIRRLLLIFRRLSLFLVVSTSELTKISMAMAVLRWGGEHHWGGAH